MNVKVELVLIYIYEKKRNEREEECAKNEKVKKTNDRGVQGRGCGMYLETGKSRIRLGSTLYSSCARCPTVRTRRSVRAVIGTQGWTIF